MNWSAQAAAALVTVSLIPAIFVQPPSLMKSSCCHDDFAWSALRLSAASLVVTKQNRFEHSVNAPGLWSMLSASADRSGIGNRDERAAAKVLDGDRKEG